MRRSAVILNRNKCNQVPLGIAQGVVKHKGHVRPSPSSHNSHAFGKQHRVGIRPEKDVNAASVEKLRIEADSSRVDSAAHDVVGLMCGYQANHLAAEGHFFGQVRCKQIVGDFYQNEIFFG